MGDFVDLKRRPSDPEDKVFYKEPKEQEYYPISLYLDKVEMDHLGLNGKQMGDEFVLELKVRVTGLSSHESNDGSSKSMNLSATAGRVASEEKRTSDKDMADALFPSMRKKG